MPEFSLTINLPLITALAAVIGLLWRLTLQVAIAIKDIAPLKEGHTSLVKWNHQQDRAVQRLEIHAGLDPLHHEMAD